MPASSERSHHHGRDSYTITAVRSIALYAFPRLMILGTTFSTTPMSMSKTWSSS